MKAVRTEQKRKLRVSLRPWLPLLISLGVTISLSSLRSALFPEPRMWHNYAGIALLVMLVMLAALNLLLHHRSQQQSGVKTLHRFRSDLLKRRDSMAHSFAKQTKRMFALLRCAYCYYFIVMGMVCGVIFFLFEGVSESIIMGYLLWGLLEMLFDLDPVELPTQELSQEDYPLLHETARTAAAIAGYLGKIRIFLGDNSIGVFAMERTECLILGVPETMLLTRQELTQVLIHEFSHVVQEDTVQSKHIARELEKWNAEKGSSLTRWSRIFLWIPQDILRREFAYYQSLSNIYRELLADAAVVKLGDPQQHINALAKCYAWQLFIQTPQRELIYDLYEPVAPRKDYYHYILNVFRMYLQREEPHIREIFAREIPLQFDSHPIFRIRAENAGVSEYSLTSEETDPAYGTEIHKLILDCNRQLLAASSMEDYAQDRQVNYQERKAVIEEAHKVRDFDALSTHKRLSYAMALANVEPTLQKEVLESILRQEPDNNYAVWLLAQALYYEDDERCIELLYRASRLNNNYVQDAYTRIGNFALQAGRQDLLETYGGRAIEHLQWSRQLDDQLCNVRPGDQLEENDLPTDVFNEVRKQIFHLGGRQLTHLYTLKKMTIGGPAYFYFLEFGSNTEKKVRKKIYREIFLYLDQREEHFSLFAFKKGSKLKKNILRRVPNCQII